MVRGPKFKRKRRVYEAAEEQALCRICLMAGSADAPLYTPCICRGSLAHVHQLCLQRWLLHSDRKHCELCNYHFVFKQRQQILPLNTCRNIRAVMSAALCEFWNEAIYLYACFIINLCVLPFFNLKLMLLLYGAGNLNLWNNFSTAQWHDLAICFGMTHIFSYILPKHMKILELLCVPGYSALEHCRVLCLLEKLVDMLLRNTLFQLAFGFVPYMLGLNTLILLQLYQPHENTVTPLKFMNSLLVGYLLVGLLLWLLCYRRTLRHTMLLYLEDFGLPLSCGWALHLSLFNGSVYEVFHHYSWLTLQLHLFYGIAFMEYINLYLRIFSNIFDSAAFLRTALPTKLSRICARYLLQTVVVLLLVCLPTLLISCLWPKLLDFPKQSFCRAAECLLTCILCYGTFPLQHAQSWYRHLCSTFMQCGCEYFYKWCQQSKQERQREYALAIDWNSARFYLVKPNQLIPDNYQLFKLWRLAVVILGLTFYLCVSALVFICVFLFLGQSFQQYFHPTCSPDKLLIVIVFYACAAFFVLLQLMQYAIEEGMSIAKGFCFLVCCYWLGAMLQSAILEPFQLINERTELTEFDKLCIGVPLGSLLFCAVYKNNPLLLLVISMLLWFLPKVIKFYALPTIIHNRRILHMVSRHIHSLTIIMLSCFYLFFSAIVRTTEVYKFVNRQLDQLEKRLINYDHGEKLQ